ncbi:hypothetical protein LAZ67_18002558 [Cordylochernes scorpioides]|uniref:Uncharacterized protein n=1 Tax=Cordylochernes scorpioides TaxID=51811 RepID=A0ABY6LI62_9ARAC|nr:hypothetical protein LAZ67_18002558 [Cordylochernes scorpioides]
MTFCAQNPPYASLKPEDKLLTGNDRFEGFCIDLCRELARLLHFKFELRLARDSQYGARNMRGEWTGMIRELVDREADFAIGDLTITREREEAVDFTTPFMMVGIGVLIRRPYRPPRLFYLLSPLTPEVWAYLGGAYIGVSILLYLLARFSPYEWVPGVGGYFRNQFSLANSLWFTMGSLMQQGCDISPRALSTRLVATFWWFFTLILVSTYTANLAALLIAERMKSPIETAEDLSKQNVIQYGCVEDGSTRDFFRESNNEAYSRMFHTMEHAKPRVYVPTLQEGVERVLREPGTYALLAESASLEHAAAQHCELMAVGGLLNTRGYGIATPSGTLSLLHIVVVVHC